MLLFVRIWCYILVDEEDIYIWMVGVDRNYGKKKFVYIDISLLFDIIKINICINICKIYVNW